METSKRFGLAITKLYSAFHKGELNPECSKSCAVGNICDNQDSWKYFTDTHGSVILNYVGIVHQNFGRRINGYNPLELLRIEAKFLEGCGYSLPLTHKSIKPRKPFAKDTTFNGLNAAISFLCELEGLDNVMDYSKLFEFENDLPIHKLELSVA